jgi:ADP-ribose pyrophosphatase YjhB (NUDIX family)
MSSTFPPKMPVVVSAAVRRGDELAFIRYAYGPWKGQWALPSGFVDEGEQPDVTAVRETLEECGIVAEIEGLVSVMTMVWDGTPMLYLVFTARYISGEPVPDGKEVDGAAFFGRDVLDGGELTFDGQNAWLARRILDGEARVMLPRDSREWHDTYRTTFA